MLRQSQSAPTTEANSLIRIPFETWSDLPLRGSGCGARAPAMVPSILTHPLSTFLAGLLVALVAAFLLLDSCAAPNRSAEAVAQYRSRMEKVAPSGLDAGGPAEKAALGRFASFLQGIGDVKFIRENTSKTYEADAYLDDTLVVHHGVAAIEAYFIKTSETMTSYHVTIDDVARSGDDYYLRWTMVFAAPALSGGKPVHSIGISQIRLNREGKVAFHQDFWDSGKNFYGHLPVVGGAVGFVRKRLESN
jgi:SnoaL-like domain